MKYLMIEISPTHCNEIAELLEMGEIVFVNRLTGKILHHPDFDGIGMDNEEFYEEVLVELEENLSDYWKIVKPSTRETFEIMENFTNSLADTNKLKQKLIYALTNKKPFANFKFQVDNSGEYRDAWFEFRRVQIKNWVIEQYNAQN